MRNDGPQSHLQKSGTPTMGGGLILVAMVLGTLLWADLSSRFVWIVLATTLCFGLIGFYDDYLKLVVGNSKGLAARYKYLAQSVVGLAARAVAAQPAPVLGRDLAVRAVLQDRGRAHVHGRISSRSSYFVIVGTSNAVNLTDGLDGLAIMPAVMVAAALGVFAYVTGNVKFADLPADSLHPRRRRGAHLLRDAGRARASAFSGSTPIRRRSSWATSARSRSAPRSARVAVIVRQEIVLFVMGGVFVLETVSVMLQVASFKLTGKRIFRMAPIHHHFELKGWAEPKVIVRFWIISFVLVLAGLATLKIR